MTVKQQWKRVKENWLIVLAVLILVLLLANFNITGVKNDFYSASGNSFDSLTAEAGAVSSTSSFYPRDDGFAPEVETRKITYYANVNVEVDRGDFEEKEEEFNEIVSKRNAIVLNRNVNTNQQGYDERKYGYYDLRVDVNDLDDLLNDLKGLGGVVGFGKNAVDVTGSYVSLETQLAKENERLQRYNAILAETTNVNDKISLVDKIFEQERRIALIKEALERQDERIEYATVSFSMIEEESDFANITFVTLGSLVKSFVNSVSGLLTLVFVVLPYVIVILIIWFLVRRFRK